MNVNASPVASARHIYNRGLPEAAAILARQHFRDVVAVSFDLRRTDGSASAGIGTPCRVL